MIVVKKRQIVLFLVLTLFILSGCGQENTNEDNTSGSNNDKQEQEGEAVMSQQGLEFKMNVEKVDSSLVIKMILTNVSDDMKRIEFSSGHQYDVIIRDEEGETLYNFAEGKMFTQAVITEELEPGEKLVFQDETDVIKSTSSALQIATKLNIYQIDGEAVSDQPFQLVKKWTLE